jgi:hypothetical protein
MEVCDINGKTSERDPEEIKKLQAVLKLFENFLTSVEGEPINLVMECIASQTSKMCVFVKMPKTTFINYFIELYDRYVELIEKEKNDTGA